MAREADGTILEHYRGQAAKHGTSASSTMEDVVVRDKELALIRHFFSLVAGSSSDPKRVLELGCGNGWVLGRLAEEFHRGSYHGLDFSLAMLAAARKQSPRPTSLTRSDARRLPLASTAFDIVLSERCLINILSWDEQQAALDEVARVLKPGGHWLLIECFTDGLDNNNLARTQCGLDEIKVAHHNKYFEKGDFLRAVAPNFTLIDPMKLDPSAGHLLAENFLSSHYFIARVLHPLVTRGEWVRNTEFIRFFSSLPPMGNYSHIQAMILERNA